ncbi:MAG: hypothetical protein N3E40_05590, partial [Dehalococcoidia bacterium]|nr:hypothetical protein [Dehalococcoidia bacterium]
MSIEGRIVYFERPGKVNTEEVLKIAKKRADELGIKTAVIASVTGYTAEKALAILDGMKAVIVTAHTGFSGPNEQHFSEEIRKKVLARGWKILTAPHVFGGLSYA